jgi:hypothetical protein
LCVFCAGAHTLPRSPLIWIAYPLMGGGWRGSVLKNAATRRDALKTCEHIGGRAPITAGRFLTYPAYVAGTNSCTPPCFIYIIATWPRFRIGGAKRSIPERLTWRFTAAAAGLSTWRRRCRARHSPEPRILDTHAPSARPYPPAFSSHAPPKPISTPLELTEKCARR